MNSFFKEFLDYVVAKEEELAKNHEIDCKDLKRQIYIIKAKKENIAKSCQEEAWNLNNLIERLHWIKAYSLECREKESNE